MTKIRIPIKVVRDDKAHYTRLPILYVAPIIALSLLLGFMFGSEVILPKTDPREQIGAVLESTKNTIDEASSLAKNNEENAPNPVLGNPSINNIQEALEADIAQVPTPLPLPESLLRTEELDLSITDHETTITQLNEAIARLKNDSVALVSMFNTNCGNWKDECAKPYAATLEINNSTYSDLVQKVTKLQRELGQLYAEKIARQ